MGDTVQAVVTGCELQRLARAFSSPVNAIAPPLLPSPEHSPYFLRAAAPQQRLHLAHVYLEDLRSRKPAPWLCFLGVSNPNGPLSC